MGLFIASSAECLRYISFLEGNVCHMSMFTDMIMRLFFSPHDEESMNFKTITFTNYQNKTSAYNQVITTTTVET